MGQDRVPWQMNKHRVGGRKALSPDIPARNPLVCEWEAVEEVGEQVSGLSPSQLSCSAVCHIGRVGTERF